MAYRLEAEKFKGAVISRVYFKGQPETHDYVEDYIRVARVNSSADQSCVTHTVYIKVGFSYCTS